jgi:hypothetical protein
MLAPVVRSWRGRRDRAEHAIRGQDPRGQARAAQRDDTRNGLQPIRRDEQQPAQRDDVAEDTVRSGAARGAIG